MNSLIKSKPKKNISFSRAWKITLVVCIFLFVSFRFFPSALFRVTEPVARPLWFIREKTLSLFGLAPDFFSSRQALINENTQLKQRVQDLELEAQDSLMLNTQGTLFLNQFGTLKNDHEPLVRVISRPSQSPYDILILDIGTTRVSVGDMIVGPGNIALGTITEVYSKTAKAKLFSSPGVETEAELAGSGATVILKGVGGGNMSLLVPKSFPVKTGDIFVRPGSRDRILAQVGSIQESEADSFKKVALSFPVSIFSIQWVLIYAQQ
jgi:cell shape-determining protein MreC